MEAVSNINGATQANRNNGASAAAVSAAADFETFLTLLTAQMKNQDPLKPLDSTDFVAQLASFSAVEQQVRTNDALTKIQELLGGPSATGLASWIGMQVQVLKDPEFVGTPIDVFIAPAANADRAELVVRNEAGEEVQRIPVPLKTDVTSWTGITEDGTPLADGTYQLSVESFQNGELIDDHPAPIYDEVKEARIDGDVILLVLGDGSVLLADQVAAIRGAS